jgi:hypothetical protein
MNILISSLTVISTILIFVNTSSAKYIKNGNCYLCAAPNRFDDDRRQVFCCAEGDYQKSWSFIKQSDGRYLIRSDSVGEYLYDASFPHETSLMLWKHPNIKHTKWRVQRAGSHFWHIQSDRGLYIQGTETTNVPDSWQILSVKNL